MALNYHKMRAFTNRTGPSLIILLAGVILIIVSSIFSIGCAVLLFSSTYSESLVLLDIIDGGMILSFTGLGLIFLSNLLLMVVKVRKC